MKKRLFSFLCVLILLASAVPAASALQGEAQRAQDTLSTLQLLPSQPSLTSTVTRAQAAVLLVRLAGAQKAAAAAWPRSYFKDAPAATYPTVAYAAGQGWVNGVAVGQFRPKDPATANAWFASLLRMLGYSDKAGDFTASGAALFAQHIGLTSRLYTGTMTYGQIYESMVEALAFAYKGTSTTVLQKLVDTGICARSTANALGLLTPELTARQAADRYMAAVFCMETFDDQGIDTESPSGSASGFFIDGNGTAVVSYHAISGKIHANITLVTGEVYPVESVLAYDPDIDFAVVRVSRTSTSGKTTSAFAHLDLVSTDDIRAGDKVYALGNPLGLGLAVSSGIISATARHASSYTLPCIVSSADISQGSSGGALLNVYGQVIGITTGSYTYGNNMYLSVPIDPVLKADLSGPGKTLAQVAADEAMRVIEEN